MFWNSSDLTPRRHFLATIPAVVGGLLAAPAALHAIVSDSIDSSREAPLDAIPAGLPHPRYLPGRYRLTYSRHNPQSGFKGHKQVILLYGSPGLGARPMPLAVYLTADRSATLLGTNDAEPIPVSLTVGGEIVPAFYFDGTWKPDRNGTRVALNGKQVSWTRDNGHALVARVREMTVGIRGYRSAGVTRADLGKIAESLR